MYKRKRERERQKVKLAHLDWDSQSCQAAHFLWAQPLVMDSWAWGSDGAQFMIPLLIPFLCASSIHPRSSSHCPPFHTTSPTLLLHSFHIVWFFSPLAINLLWSTSSLMAPLSLPFPPLFLLDFLVERDNDYCVCETPCNMTRYGKELSFVKIPSKASAKYLAKKFNKTEQYIA